MQVKQMLFPMMSMVLSMAPCSHLHAQGQTPVSQMEKLDRGLEMRAGNLPQLAIAGYG